MEGIAKPNFLQELISGKIKLYFLCILVSLGPLFMTFGAMGAGLNFHGFSGLPGGKPEFRERTSGRVDSLFPGLKPRTTSNEP